MNQKHYLLLLPIASLCFLLLAFQAISPSSPKKAVEQYYKDNLLAFENSLIELENTVQKYGTPKNKTLIQESYINTRKQYKRIETFLEYYHPDFCKNYINGAPLPKLEEGIDQAVIQKPKGLQVLDELIYSDSLEIAEIKIEISQLKTAIAPIVNNKLIKIEDRAVFEATRQALVRIFTLGITGFDTPGSVNGITDSKEVLISLEEIIRYYSPSIKEKNKTLQKKISYTLSSSVQYAQANTDFDSFDRVYFLKNYINPLYQYLLEAHLLLGIETNDEVNQYPKPIRYKTTNIFDSNFLNRFYYIQLPEKKYSEKILELGKLLFYDPVLSSSNERSCASCHQPNKAFTDGMAKSTATGFQGTVTRNAPTLINAVYADKFFYDLRSNVLEDQIEHVIVNEKEFHTSYIQLYEKLSQSEDYLKLFAAAFPEIKEKPINKYAISTALGIFVASLTSHNSQFDLYIRNEIKEIPTEVIKGFNLFAGKAGCATCHFAPIFNGTTAPLYRESESEVLGVPEQKNIEKIDSDLGRASGKMKEQSTIYLHSFKTPSIRNIQLTAPYMHNGVYNTLEEVMDFYNKGGGAGIGIKLENQTLPPEALNLNKEEINQIIRFMESLTDTSIQTTIPKTLPQFENNSPLNQRKIGGVY